MGKNAATQKVTLPFYKVINRAYETMEKYPNMDDARVIYSLILFRELHVDRGMPVEFSRDIAWSVFNIDEKMTQDFEDREKKSPKENILREIMSEAKVLYSHMAYDIFPDIGFADDAAEEDSTTQTPSPDSN